MRAPNDDISPPSFPRELAWHNVAVLTIEQQAARPVLVDFLDVLRPQCVRVLPYVQAWHDRYGPDLRVISVHTPGFAPGRDPEVVRAELDRLGVEHAVALDLEGDVYTDYAVRGWPSRYLFRRGLRLLEFHFGEGGYAETEAAIREALGLEPADPVPPVRPEDAGDALLVAPTPEQAGAYCGPYEAGEVWVVAAGAGELLVDGAPYVVDRPGAHLLRRHETSVSGVLDLRPGDGVEVLATVFSPGLAQG